MGEGDTATSFFWINLCTESSCLVTCDISCNVITLFIGRKLSFSWNLKMQDQKRKCKTGNRKGRLAALDCIRNASQFDT